MVCPLTSVFLSLNFNKQWDLKSDRETSDNLKSGSVVSMYLEF
jgi:hypothetical protein